jgi:hypothetical protein
MPKLDLNMRKDKYIQVQNANHVYGNVFLKDDSPSYQPYLGGWFSGVILGNLSGQVKPYYYCNTPAVDPVNLIIYTDDWPQEKNPFTQMNLLNREEEQLRELISMFRTTLSIQYRENLANRLNVLFHEAKEENPSNIGIAIGSLRCFYNFLKLNIDLTCPTISLTPENNIYATWRESINHLLSVHFLPNGDTRFVIFKPNARHPEKKIRISGTATFDILMETVEPHGVKDWISLWKATTYQTKTI